MPDVIRVRGGGDGAFPSLIEIYKIVNETAKNKRYLQICNDHIYIVPDKEEYRILLFEYVLIQNTVLWETYIKLNEEKVINEEKIIYIKFNKRKLRTKFYISIIDILKKIKLYNIVKKIIKG
jgi:hypothetical protein